MAKYEFEKWAENISGIDYNGNRYGKPVNDVSAWYMQEEYERSIGSERNDDAVEFDIDGVKYVEHWFFTNEVHDSSVVGYSLIPENGDGDVQFCVVGCRVDRVCTFDEMIDYLTNQAYFVD